jgi:hypothetical protein
MRAGEAALLFFRLASTRFTEKALIVLWLLSPMCQAQTARPCWLNSQELTRTLRQIILGRELGDEAVSSPRHRIQGVEAAKPWNRKLDFAAPPPQQ